MNTIRKVACAAMLAGASLAVLAQDVTPSDQDLFLYGQIGYANGNCVKASRYWFAYLLRRPADLTATRQAQLEQVISMCDARPTQIAYANAMFKTKKPVKQEQCDQYADLAVAQYEAQRLSGCGFAGPRWSPDHAYHANWCMGAKDMEPNTELNARKGLMASCAPGR